MEDQILFTTPWLEMRRRDGYDYVHEIRCHGHIVVILGYRLMAHVRGTVYEFLLRNEATPCWENDALQVSSITGGCERVQETEGVPDAERFIPDAMRELQEEAGYQAPAERWAYLGRSFGSKSNSCIYHLFAVDLTDIEAGEVTGDGSCHEALASNFWSYEIHKSVCPLVCTAYVRGRHQGLFP